MKNVNKQKIKIAIPNKGRLLEPTLDLLKAIGFEFEKTDRKLSTSVANFDIEILYISAASIPEYVENGTVQLGITGWDLVKERDAKVDLLHKLGYGNVSLVVAAPESSGISSVKGLAGKKIATTFPSLTRKFLKEQGVRAEVIEVDGAVEITPKLGLVDAIADLSSSGYTLKVNKLTVLATILESEAVLIGNAKERVKEAEIIKEILLRLESVLTAVQKRYIMMNAPLRLLPRIKKIAPGLSSPTIMKLSQPGMIAVHSVVDANDVWRIINELKRIGASGILVIPIERMID